MRKSKQPKEPLDIHNLPEKFPKKAKEGKQMDYTSGELAFPKPVKKKKKGRWGK